MGDLGVLVDLKSHPSTIVDFINTERVRRNQMFLETGTEGKDQIRVKTTIENRISKSKVESARSFNTSKLAYHYI